MDFTSIITRSSALCEAKGIDKRVYTKSGAGKDFISNIKKGSAPSVEKVLALADYLDCSVDYLLGRTDDPTSHVKATAVNKRLIVMVSQLTNEQQEMLEAQIKGLLDQKKDPPPNGDGK